MTISRLESDASGPEIVVAINQIQGDITEIKVLLHQLTETRAERYTDLVERMARLEAQMQSRPTYKTVIGWLAATLALSVALAELLFPFLQRSP